MNDIDVVLKKLDPNPNDLFTVTLPAYISHADKLTVANLLGKIASHHNITIMILNEGITVDSIPEEQMNLLGWYRK